MIRLTSLCAVAALALAACSPAPEPADGAEPAPNAAEPREATVNAQGWGPIRIGMTTAELELAVGPMADTGDFGECVEGRPANAPEGMLVMTEQGVVTRISLIRDSDLKTDRGFGIGDTAEAVKAAYGEEAGGGPHKYEPAPAEYIEVWSRSTPGVQYQTDPESRGIVYEIGGDGLVRAIRAGGPSIQYVEGCA